MRHGTQGHVALPRGCDVSFTYIFYYIGYSTYKHSIEEFKLTVINRSPYIPDASPKFPPCGTINL